MKPSICVVLSSLKDEEGLSTVNLSEPLSGNPPAEPNPNRTKARDNKYESLRRIVDSWGTITDETYIESIASHFNSV